MKIDPKDYYYEPYPRERPALQLSNLLKDNSYPQHIGNHPEEDRAAILQAAAETGAPVVVGKLLPEASRAAFGVWVTEKWITERQQVGCLGEFWDAFQRIKNEESTDQSLPAEAGKHDDA